VKPQVPPGPAQVAEAACGGTAHGSQLAPAHPWSGVNALTHIPPQSFWPVGQWQPAPLSTIPLGHTQAVPEAFLTYPAVASHVKSQLPAALHEVETAWAGDGQAVQ
jgi:hypothetical protein